MKLVDKSVLLIYVFFFYHFNQLHELQIRFNARKLTKKFQPIIKMLKACNFLENVSKFWNNFIINNHSSELSHNPGKLDPLTYIKT